MKKLLFIVLAAALCLASCDQLEQLENGLGGKSSPVAFAAYVGPFTKVTGTAFDEGDQIGITALAPINRTNVCYTVSGGSLNASDPICWAADQTDATTFIGVYPFKNGLDPTSAFTFSASDNQTSGLAASDLLAAKASAKEGAVQLAFTHKMSKISITVEGLQASAVAIANVPLTVNADIVADTFTGTDARGTVQACKLSDGTWEAIVAPHKGYAGVVKVTTADGKTVEIKPSETSKELGSGKQVSATVSAAQAKPVSYTYVIEDWVSAGNVAYTPGAGEDMAEHSLFLSVNDKYIPMEYAGDCKWSVTNVFEERDRSVIYIDNRFFGRGFEDNHIQFDGTVKAMTQLYYWITDFPCKATITYDMANEKIEFSYNDTWVDAGRVTIKGNLLQGLNFPPAADTTVTVPWQKNKYGENIYRAVGPLDYLKASGVKVGDGHLVVNTAVTANDVSNNVYVYTSNLGVEYVFWPDEDPDYYYPVFLDGLSIYGVIEDNVITFFKGSFVVMYYNNNETIVNTKVTLTILN